MGASNLFKLVLEFLRIQKNPRTHIEFELLTPPRTCLFRTAEELLRGNIVRCLDAPTETKKILKP